MTEVKDLLSNSIGAAPASTIDVERTITRLRRKARRRRTLTAAAVVAAVAVTSVGAHLSLARGTGSPTGFPYAAPPTLIDPSPTPARAETERELTARLTGVIQGHMRRAMPGASFVANVTDPDYPPVEAFEVWAVRPHGVPDSAPWAHLQASADIHDAAGVGNVLVVVGRVRAASDAVYWCGLDATPYPVATTTSARGRPAPATSCDGLYALAGEQLDVFTSCEGDDPSCHVVIGPRGERVVAFTDFAGGEANSRGYRINVTKPDGTTIMIKTENLGLVGATGKTSSGERAQPPLTVEQMIEIALDEMLSIVAPTAR
jgi:hypothetical protein